MPITKLRMHMHSMRSRGRVNGRRTGWIERRLLRYADSSLRSGGRCAGQARYYSNRS